MFLCDYRTKIYVELCLCLAPFPLPVTLVKLQLFKIPVSTISFHKSYIKITYTYITIWCACPEQKFERVLINRLLTVRWFSIDDINALYTVNLKKKKKNCYQFYFYEYMCYDWWAVDCTLLRYGYESFLTIYSSKFTHFYFTHLVITIFSNQA